MTLNNFNVIHLLQAFSGGIFHISYIKKNVPLSVLKTLYSTLVQPYLEYCNIVWAIHRSTALNSLYLIQKKAVGPAIHNFLTPECPLSPIVSQIANPAHF